MFVIRGIWLEQACKWRYNYIRIHPQKNNKEINTPIGKNEKSAARSANKEKKRTNGKSTVLFKADLKWLNDLDVITLEDKFF